MKTYLLISENLCRRCGRRWTSSAVADRTGFPLSPSVEVEEVAGFFTSKREHQACFNCLGPETPELPRHWQAALRPPPVKAIPPKTATLDDILGD